jgi:hypothetical protein
MEMMMSIEVQISKIDEPITGNYTVAEATTELGTL